MKKSIQKFLEQIKDQFEEKVISIMGQKTERILRQKHIFMESYDNICDDSYLEPINVTKIFIEDGNVMVQIKDNDDDRYEQRLRDFTLGEMEAIISLL